MLKKHGKMATFGNGHAGLWPQMREVTGIIIKPWEFSHLGTWRQMREVTGIIYGPEMMHISSWLLIRENCAGASLSLT